MSPFFGPNCPFVGCYRPVGYPNVGIFIPSVGYRGFTLIELLITVSVLAILITLASTGISRFVHSNRLTTTTNDLIADINFARSEAIKRAAVAGICQSSTGTGCTGTKIWAAGWAVMVDTNGDGILDEVLRVHEALATGNTLEPMNTNTTTLLYDRLGMLSSGSDVFQVSNSRINQTRRIGICGVGSPSITKADKCL